MGNSSASPDWSVLRDLFPALDTCAYLDTASSGPVSTPAAAAAKRFYGLSNAYGNKAASQWNADVDQCRQRIARLIGAAAAEIGFVPNTSMAMNVAALLFEGQGEVLTGAGEHPTVMTPWLARGYTMRVARPTTGKPLTINAYADAITPETRVIAVSHVRFNDGQVNDLKALSALARAYDAHLVVDIIQSAGILPVDVGIGIDVLGFAGFKWLNAGYGGGGLFVRDGLIERYGLPIAGNRSRRTEGLDEVTSLDPLLRAQAFELGTVPVPNLLALRASLDLIHSIGAGAIEARVASLTARLRKGLDSLGIAYVSGEPISPIVSIGVSNPQTVHAGLEAAGVHVALRAGRIRAAVSWYNNETDIDRLLEALRTVAT
ncbi:Cysteine desulfurase SufS [Alphaproteobacteria bacterium SO-S41]|nr:Cysteine desulfurase SufS [Alphaproteobacteria bacterium SO-S41]